MEFFYEGKLYKTQYFPFFRIKKLDGYQIFGLRYPSGRIERIFVVNQKSPISELIEYSKFLIKEYMQEENDALTLHARLLKEDVCELFGQK
jgi:hypothetical protein